MGWDPFFPPIREVYLGRKCSELRVTFHRLLPSFQEGCGDSCRVAVSLRAGVCGREGTRQPGPRPRARAPWEGTGHSCRQSGKNQAAWSKQPVTTGCGRKKSLFQTRKRHEQWRVSWGQPREGRERAACSGAQTPGRTDQVGQAGSNQRSTPWRHFGDRPLAQSMDMPLRLGLCPRNPGREAEAEERCLVYRDPHRAGSQHSGSRGCWWPGRRPSGQGP